MEAGLASPKTDAVPDAISKEQLAKANAVAKSRGGRWKVEGVRWKVEVGRGSGEVRFEVIQTGMEADLASPKRDAVPAISKEQLTKANAVAKS